MFERRRAFIFLVLFTMPLIAAAEVWRPLPMAGLDDAWLKIGHELQTYDDIYIDDIGVWHLGHTSQTDESTNTMLRKHARTALSQRLAATGLAIAATPSESALTLRLQIIDLKFHDASAFVPALANQYRFPIKPGHVTFVIEIVEGRTTDVVLRAAAVDALEFGSGIANPMDDAAWTKAIATTLRPTINVSKAPVLARR